MIYPGRCLSSSSRLHWAAPTVAHPALVAALCPLPAQCRGLAASASDLDASIREHRMGTLVIQAQPNARVRVEQLRHEFWFGAALANQVFSDRMRAGDAARYKELFLQNFNAAVTEN